MKTETYLNESYRARYEAECRRWNLAMLTLLAMAIAVLVMAVVF